MTFQEFERTYSHLLPWGEAEKQIGRKLDYNNNFDCCSYHDLLVKAVQENNEKMEEKKMTETTKVFLNTWGAYNNGCIGYGWMEINEARDFIDENPEKDGGEWFIADLDNYTGVEFSSLNYCDVFEVLDTLEALENLEDYERDEVVALMEYMSTDNAQEAIDKLDRYIFYGDIDMYHDSCDELIECELQNTKSILYRYFDYAAYHRDCDFDIYEASNGVCIVCY